MTSVNDSNPDNLPSSEATPSVDEWQDWVDGGVPVSAADGRMDPEISSGASTVSEESLSEESLAAAPAAYPLVGGGSASGLQSTPAIPAPPLALVETAFLASTTSLLWLINAYFPIGPIWRICMPIPIALVYLRWERREAWMTASVAGLLLMVFMGPVRSLFFLMPYGLLGVMLGYCWRRQTGWWLSIGLGTILNALGFFFKVGLTSILLGEDLWIYVTTQVTKILDWISIKLGLLIQADLAMVQLLAIALVLLNGIIYLFVVHLVAWYLLDRLGAKVTPPPKWVQIMLELEVDDEVIS